VKQDNYFGNFLANKERINYRHFAVLKSNRRKKTASELAVLNRE
jgi:hypothetical protein